MKTEELPGGVPEKAIRPVGTLHLTLGVMNLVTKAQVDSVLNLLRDIDFKGLLRSSNPSESSIEMTEDNEDKGKKTEETSPTEPLKITLKGLKSMQSASKTAVLYSSPIGSDTRLHKFCKSLQHPLIQAGFVAEQKKRKKLLLHTTILNTIYAKKVQKEKPNWEKGKVRLLFNSREILDRYGEFVWMEDVTIEKVAVCRIGAKMGEDGEERYEVEGEFNI